MAHMNPCKKAMDKPGPSGLLAGAHGRAGAPVAGRQALRAEASLIYAVDMNIDIDFDTGI